MLKERLLKRGETGGREDDNEETDNDETSLIELLEETINKRIESYTKDT